MAWHGQWETIATTTCPECGAPMDIKRREVGCIKMACSYDDEREATGYDYIRQCTQCDYVDCELADLSD